MKPMVGILSLAKAQSNELWNIKECLYLVNGLSRLDIYCSRVDTM